MTLQEINKAYNRIIGSLDDKELKNAFDSLHALITGSEEYSFSDKLNELQETYKYMLRYHMDGIKDPMQTQIHENILISTYELSDAVKQKALSIASPLSFYNRRRYLKMQPFVSYEQLYKQLLLEFEAGKNKEWEAIETTLFNKIWISEFLNQEEVVQIKEILTDPELPLTTSCQIVSALMLGLQEAFDKEKLLLLFDAANNPEEDVKIRAIISILLTLYLYRKRISLYPQITNRLALLAENPGFDKTVRTITLQFIIARETEKITRKLQEEILPEMMKISPKLSNKINLKDITLDQLEEGMNPEWENILSDSNLGKKIEEFSELQLEGADVMHSTFIHLKNFPFFREISNWLRPFTINHSMFNNQFDQKSNTEKEVLDTMALTSFMCNSDKYSLYFSMMQLPADAQKMMMNQVDSQTTEMIQQNREKLINQRGKQNIIISQYIQDLYRFFKLYPGHLDFTDIFSLPLDFHNLESLHPYISDKESLTMIAECYLRKNYYNDALTIYKQLAEIDFDSDILFQKVGYCKQMEGDIEGALKDYLHADLINPDSKWVIKHIAACYRSLKKPQEALTYYRRYEALNPDNLSIQFSIGNCLLELKDYNEAIKCFFKVDYLDHKSHKAWRPIAWCSFLTGKYDQAKNYYKKILDNKPNAQDLLNAGHTEWALQNIKGALSYYQQVVQKEDGDFNKFQDLFNQDIPDLLVAGIETPEITLMLEQLRYKISGDL